MKYWETDWQKVILTAVDEAMARGFDGVYLDIVDGFETYEQDGKEFIDDRINPRTKQSYRRDMVDWVTTIAKRARAKNPAALIIPQNGSQLLAHADFLETISAIGMKSPSVLPSSEKAVMSLTGGRPFFARISSLIVGQGSR